MWFLERLTPASPLYNIPTRIRLRGTLNETALQRSLEAIIRRHEALRTRFREEQGALVLQVQPSVPVPIAVTDLRDLPETERESMAQRLVEQEVNTPFDLSRAPLLRTHLYRLADQEYWWVVTTHHMVSDGRSQFLFLQEWLTLYEAYNQGESSPLPPLSFQYTDY
ncbi:hypothetical protein CEN49_24170, partial [Fischerella thermalis CCMEE 5273]